MGKIKNIETVKGIKDKVARAKSVIITDYLGISASDANDLRQKMKDAGAEMLVTKNTLLKVALKENATTEKADMTALEKDLEGPTAAIFSFDDAISPIKVIFEFAKKAQFPKVKSAIIDGIYTNAAKIEIIKDLPSKEQLLAQAVGGFKAPLNGFVNVLGGVQRKFVYAMKAIADQKGGVK
jgi:large subunit ribosomal protein L10